MRGILGEGFLLCACVLVEAFSTRLGSCEWESTGIASDQKDWNALSRDFGSLMCLAVLFVNTVFTTC